MKNKRVLFINSIVGTGSTGRIISGLCHVLKEHGVESLVCYGRGGAPENIDTFRIGSDSDVYLHGALSRITDRHGLYSKRATEGLVRRIKAFRPDLIHLHNLHGYYLNYEILMDFIRHAKLPVIWTLHDCWTFTGHCTHFEYAGCEKYKTGCFECGELKQYPRSLLMDASKSNYERKKRAFCGIEHMRLVTPSFWLRERVGESFLKDYESDVIPTGIDLDTFKPLPSDIRERYGIGDRILLLGVANPWRERKGLDDFIRLAGSFSDEIKIAMIGLKKKQLSLIPDNVIALEKTESVEEMAQWYSAADIHVNLTREDTFPTTNIESLACGTPVITYRAGGSPESLDETCGRIIEKDDLKGVINAVTEFGKKTDRIREACLRHSVLYDRRDRFKEYYEKCYKPYL